MPFLHLISFRCVGEWSPSTATTDRCEFVGSGSPWFFLFLDVMDPSRVLPYGLDVQLGYIEDTYMRPKQPDLSNSHGLT